MFKVGSVEGLESETNCPGWIVRDDDEEEEEETKILKVLAAQLMCREIGGL